MKVSLEWLSDFVDLPRDKTPAELAHDLTLKTVEVEEIIDTAAPYQSIVVAVVEHVETGGGWIAVRCGMGDGQSLEVLTRHENVVPGMKVALALPGAELIASEGAAATEVAVAEVKGRKSEAILCTAANLALQRMFPGSSSAEALDLSHVDAATPGVPLADALGLKDIVFEIDNKSLTNRPDLWGHYGIAREFATIYGAELRPLTEAAVLRPAEATDLIGQVDAAVCQRLSAVSFQVETREQAPLWMRSRLSRIGEASVGLVVDLSNYVMFTVGQPTHVYDADRISLPLGVAASVRTPAKLELLTGVSSELVDGVAIITDASGPVAVAGVMGSAESSVTSGSQRFVLEAATFMPRVVRRASQRLNLRTEASMRFEKGLDTQRVDQAVDLFLSLLRTVAEGSITVSMQDVTLTATPRNAVTVDLDFLAKRIGTHLDEGEVKSVLRSLGFKVDIRENDILATAPTWRSTGDISQTHDIVEEVARIHGYDNLPTAPITIQLNTARSLNRRPIDRIAREILGVRAGLQEVITYPWTTDALLAAAGFDKTDTIRFDGAPSPDRDSVRPSLIPNLLEAAVSNAGFSAELGIFEAGTVFASGPMEPYQSIYEPMPKQSTRVAALLTGSNGELLYRKAKGILETLHEYGHIKDLSFVDLPTATWADRSARSAISAEGEVIGTLGLLTKRSKRMAGLAADYVACFEIDLDGLSVHSSRNNQFEKLSDLPEADFDLSVVVADEVTWTAVERAARGGHHLVHRVEFVDEFRGAWVPQGHRSLSLRMTLRPEGSTLTSEIIAEARAAVLDSLTQQTGAQLRA